MKIQDIAKITHEANESLCETQGDFSQVCWELAPEWQKQSAVNGVRFHIENPLATPENSHESWMKEKEQSGWKYGPFKDADKKEHPCFVPYSELPPEQQAKDYLFRSIVHALAPFVS